MRETFFGGAAVAALAIVCGGSAAFAGPIAPVYSYSFSDSVTGTRQFQSAGKHYWDIEAGADDYFSDVYERPTAQTFVSVGGKYAAKEYFGYVDIVSGQYGYDSQYMYFAIELFSNNHVNDSGTQTNKFGDGTYYNVRFSSDVNGAYGLNLSVQDPSKLNGSFVPLASAALKGYYDKDGSVGGPGGVFTPGEYASSSDDGFTPPIIDDGKLKDASSPYSNAEVFFARKITNSDGRPVVEIAFDYLTFNAATFTSLAAGFPADIDPATILNYLVFDAARGLKGNGTYLWNDKYTFAQAGSPYQAMKLENIYEVDSLRGFAPLSPPPPEITVVPLPPAVAMGFACVGLIGGARAWRRRMTAQE